MENMSCSSEPYDVVVIGAGILGSSAAYHCVKGKDDGRRVLLLEQYALPHSRGGSHGGNRIFLIAAPDKCRQSMIEESYSLWKTLENETKTEILRENGILGITNPDKVDGFTAQFLNDIERSGKRFEKLSEGEMTQRFPNFTSKSKLDVVFYTKAGFIRANKAITAFQSEFLRRGGVLKDEEKMQEIIPGAMVTIKTNQGVYRAKSLILALGAWTPKVLKQLGLTLKCKVSRVHHMFWKEKCAGTYRDFPCFDHRAPDGWLAYGFPSQEFPGLMKVSLWLPNVITDPDQRDAAPDASREFEKTRDYVREHFHELDADNGPAITEACVTISTEDHDFILDVHPDHSNIAFECGDESGGFQFAPVLGKLLSQLALGQTTSHDIQPMSNKRFL